MPVNVQPGSAIQNGQDYQRTGGIWSLDCRKAGKVTLEIVAVEDCPSDSRKITGRGVRNAQRESTL